MASNNASVGGLNFRIGADSSALVGDLGKAEKTMKTSAEKMNKTAAAIRLKPTAGAGSTGGGMDERAKRGAEAANKLAAAGGISGLGPIAALGSLGPAALGAGVALGAMKAAVSLATDAFNEFKTDQSKNATKMTAAGEAIEDFSGGLKQAATTMTGEFLDAITGGALEARQAEQQRGRDLDRANAEMFKKSQARQAIEKQKTEALGQFIGGFKSMMLRREAAQLQMQADQLAKDQEVDFDPDPIAEAIISTNTAQMATYGSESALETLDTKRLQEEQKQSMLLAEIAKNGKNQITVVEF